MATTFQIFKGGFANCPEHTDRIAVNQRPADGHLKSAAWEDYSRLNRDRFQCAMPELAVGDVIQIHTLLTFGLIESFGIAVRRAEEGLKFKVVVSDPAVVLSRISVQTYQYDQSQEKYAKVGAETAITAIDDIGNAPRYYAGYTAASAAQDLIRVDNAATIGLQVVALPSDGLKGDFDIETRLQMRQSVRPQAHFGCC